MKRTLFCLFLVVCLLLPLTVSAAAQSPALLSGEGTEEDGPLFYLTMLVLVPCGGAAVICLILKSKMKTARKQTAASNYMVSSMPKLTVETDRFTHRTQTRRKIQRKQSN